MKRPLLFSALLFLSGFASHAQDTLLLRNEKIACKVMRITDTEIEYKKWNNLDGPVYVMSANRVYSIHYQNGSSENFKNGKPANTPVNIDDVNIGRHAIKLDLFSPAFHKISLGYEYALNNYFGFELYSGFVSSKLLKSPRKNYYGIDPQVQGVAFRLGTKFWLGRPLNMNSHHQNSLMGGWFMRLDLMYARLALTNVTYTDYLFESHYYYPVYSRRLCSVDNNQFGMALNIGWQTLLGKHIVVQLNGGFGYLYNFCTVKPGPEIGYQPHYSSYSDSYSFNPYGSGVNIDNTPICITGNFTLGYVFGKKKK